MVAKIAIPLCLEKESAIQDLFLQKDGMPPWVLFLLMVKLTHLDHLLYTYSPLFNSAFRKQSLSFKRKKTFSITHCPIVFQTVSLSFTLSLFLYIWHPKNIHTHLTADS